ncbi:MAG: hypothetical protein Q9170_003990 [Blastenia crenularia]
MGQEASAPVDESTPTQTLSARTLDAVASYIKDGRAQKIVVMTGAGISTAAGIPDFRSPGTGLYANLAKLNLPYPQAVFDISYFRSNPLPFYTLAHEIYPGKYKPTISHCFVRLLSDKGLLLKLFTQNIDCLERTAGVPTEKIVEAHGSFARQRCIECQRAFADNSMKEAIDRHEVPRCMYSACNGLVKPDIVFFGEALPEDFHRNRTLPSSADLAIVMGTSLTVQPFASLPGFCAEGVPRVLLNSERVGGLGCRADDVLVLGDCDEGVRKLASALGWLQELEALFETHNPEKGPEVQHKVPKLQARSLDDEIADITRQVDSTLRLSSEYCGSLGESMMSSKPTLPQQDTLSDKVPVLDRPGITTHAARQDSPNRKTGEDEGEEVHGHEGKSAMIGPKRKSSNTATPVSLSV